MDILTDKNPTKFNIFNIDEQTNIRNKAENQILSSPSKNKRPKLLSHYEK